MSQLILLLNIVTENAEFEAEGFSTTLSFDFQRASKISISCKLRKHKESITMFIKFYFNFLNDGNGFIPFLVL